jgi:hypothetical protein
VVQIIVAACSSSDLLDPDDTPQIANIPVNPECATTRHKRSSATDSIVKQPQQSKRRHCERQRSNPSRRISERWIASSQVLLAMTSKAKHTFTLAGDVRPEVMQFVSL